MIRGLRCESGLECFSRGSLVAVMFVDNCESIMVSLILGSELLCIRVETQEY